MGLCGVYMGVYVGLHGDFFERWWGKNQDFILIRLFNPNDLIGCGGDINQSDSVGLRRSMWVYVGLCGSMWVYTEDFF